MKYTEKDIRNIPLTEFMAALGEKPVKTYNELQLYYSPYRNDPEPVFVVDTQTNRWYDHGTDESGNIVDLAKLKMNPGLDKEPKAFIVRYMNDYEVGKEMVERSRRPVEPVIINIEVSKVKLTDFMKALGYEQPVKKDGPKWTYPAPYDPEHKPTMVIDTDRNEWRDETNKCYGNIYDLAYELTGSCMKSELNWYVATEMSAVTNVEAKRVLDEHPVKSNMERKAEEQRRQQETDHPKPKQRKFRR